MNTAVMRPKGTGSATYFLREADEETLLRLTFREAKFPPDANSPSLVVWYKSTVTGWETVSEERAEALEKEMRGELDAAAKRLAARFGGGNPNIEELIKGAVAEGLQ